MRAHQPAMIAVLLAVTVGVQGQNLAFRSTEAGQFVFDTGAYRGLLQVDDTHQGILSLVDVKTGEELAKGIKDYGLFNVYRLLASNKRWGDAGWTLPKKCRLTANGSVRIDWTVAENRPFDLAAVFQWQAPDTLDMEIAVTPRQDLLKFEVFLSSYVKAGMRGLVYLGPARHGSGKAALMPGDATPLTIGTYLSFPRNLEAAQLVCDGRWEQGQNPVQWSITRYLAAPLAMRQDPKSGQTLLFMARPQDCFAIETSYNMDPPDGVAGHYSTYLSLFGQDLKAGKEAKAVARLVAGRGISPEAAMELYRQFTSTATPGK
ncbi:MAG TPA: hypothetical protein PKY77_17105 [Phycisphaerae bacterium]|nr:hypothetical protein [Phycisphaerae bacterium]HRY66909.1 hypothetical protein [Phycisphaerae bacterium]HSA27857.1 hypothetical protein [Phycisphaerae bacterium]